MRSVPTSSDDRSAKELEIDLIVLAQMNRVGMDAVGKTQAPTLDQIRGTDALSHVSHAVWIARKDLARRINAQKAKRGLELWHAKTRGRQAFWDGRQCRAWTSCESQSCTWTTVQRCQAEEETPVPKQGDGKLKYHQRAQ